MRTANRGGLRVFSWPTTPRWRIPWGAAGRAKRTPLQAVSIAEFDLIFGIVEDAIEAMVQVGDVVSTVEIVIDENFPVAVHVITTPFEPVEMAGLQVWKVFECGRSVGREADPDPILPLRQVDMHETRSVAIEVTDSSEVWCGLEATFQ